MYKPLLKLIPILLIAFFMNACVEDDDFDVPEIPPVEEIRELISVGGVDAPFLSCLDEDFESYSDDTNEFDAYENVTTFDTRLWSVGEFANNKYLSMSAFRANGLVYSYFVIPVNFDEADAFSFTSQDRFNNGDPLQIFIVTDYTVPESITDATLEEITSSFTISTGNDGSASQPAVFSGEYDLTDRSGNGFIAFRYTGDGSTDPTTTIQLDDIQLIDNDDPSCDISTGGGAFESVGGDSASATNCLSEDFESGNEGDNEFGAYENIAYTGGRFWEVDQYNDNNYLKMSAYDAGGAVQSYFVVPVNFDDADSFSFSTQDRFNNGDVLTVYTTTDHVIGEDIANATLTDITSSFTIASGTTGSASEPFVESGSYSFSSLSGEGFIVFEYSGVDGGTTTTMHIDNILIADADDSSCDVSGGNTGGQYTAGGDSATPTACIADDFEGYTTGAGLAGNPFPNYYNVDVTGEELWEVKTYNDNKYVQMSAFENATHDTWLLLNVDFDGAEEFSFKTKDGFNNGAPLTVWYSTTHVGGEDVDPADWTEITSEFTIANNAPGNGYADDFTNSGVYSLASITGTGFIAFRYQGSADGTTTTMQIDDVLVKDTDDATCELGGNTGGGDTSDLIISEIADPANNAGARYVEIYNPNSSDVDLTGWQLLLYSNANTTAGGTTDLTGTIAAGGTYIVANNTADFETEFGVTANTQGNVNSNGDDNFELVNPDGDVVDVFGVPGEDGTGTDHEFTDGRAVRNETVTTPNSVYTASEWTITMDVDTNTGEYTPGTHPDDDNTGGGDGDLVNNGDMESWTSGVLDVWTSESGTTITEETTIVDEGSSSAKFEVTTGTQGDTDFRQTVSVVENTTYTVSVRIYQEDNGARARLYVAGYQNYSDPSVTGSWQDVTYEYTATATEDIEVGLRFYDTGDFTGSSIIYVDDFKMVAQ